MHQDCGLLTRTVPGKPSKRLGEGVLLNREVEGDWERAGGQLGRAGGSERAGGNERAGGSERAEGNERAEGSERAGGSERTNAMEFGGRHEV